MAYKTILVGTDGSETARIAENVASLLAAALSAELVILTAITSADDAGAAEGLLEDAAGRARRLGLDPTTRARAGEPSAVIVEDAEETAADLIVVGNRGMGRARRFMLGGVPDHVAHHSPVDLLVVKTTHPEAGTRGDRLYRNVLIATDGSFTADQAAGRGYDLAAALGAGLGLVYVGDEVIGEIVLRDTSERLGKSDMSRKVLRGDPAERICGMAQAEGFDLVVVGNKGMEGSRRYLLAAVPNQVAHNAECDVLIAKTVGRSLWDLRPGEGGIADVEGQKVAAFVDGDGTLYTVSARCQHLGCTVGWNSKARTWDCPCHGSRYDFQGGVLRGPTTKPLPPIEISER